MQAPHDAIFISDASPSRTDWRPCVPDADCDAILHYLR